MTNTNNNHVILILEDDPEQMDLLSNFALNEIQKLLDDEGVSQSLKQELLNINIIRVLDLYSLKRAAQKYPQTILAILDCNAPDTKDSAPHDQFIKSGYKITGRHRSVDIVRKYLPNTQITLISSLLRFQRIVTRYYQSQHDLNINFISKSEQEKINRNIGHYLRKYLATLSGESYRTLEAHN